jgi:riboflavin kinase/FMN adenylyltransferase
MTNRIITIGAFDGLHLGHKKLFKKTLDLAKKNNCPSTVITFNPIPKKYFNPDLKILTTINDKLLELYKIGIDEVRVLDFNPKFINISALDFLDKYIRDLNAKAVVVGWDFQFGADKSGDLDLLKKYLEQKKIDLEIIPPVMKNGKVIKSSEIRENREI